MHHSLIFHGETLHCLPSGALHWPARRLLCVSDLHLGKSERLARRGGALLPPYETQATLDRLASVLDATRPDTVVCLGDSFDDAAALDGLEDRDRLWLLRLKAGRDWIWIEGNHDAGPLDIAGTHLAELRRPPLVFRHIAGEGPLQAALDSGPPEGEVSGHFHPKVRLANQSLRAFLVDDRRLILPAFGLYTGGLWTHSPVVSALMAPRARALVCLRDAVHPIPMPRSSTASR